MILSLRILIVSTLLKKSIPWIIIGGAAVAGGIILYKKGYLKGISIGKELGIDEIAAHLSTPNRFTVIRDSACACPPVIAGGIELKSESDIPKALKVVESVINPEDFATAKDKITATLTGFIPGGKN